MSVSVIHESSIMYYFLDISKLRIILISINASTSLFSHKIDLIGRVVVLEFSGWDLPEVSEGAEYKMALPCKMLSIRFAVGEIKMFLSLW